MLIQHKSPFEITTFILLPSKPKLIGQNEFGMLLECDSDAITRVIDYSMRIISVSDGKPNDQKMVIRSIARGIDTIIDLPFPGMSFEFVDHCHPRFKCNSEFCTTLDIPKQLNEFVNYASFGSTVVPPKALPFTLGMSKGDTMFTTDSIRVTDKPDNQTLLNNASCYRNYREVSFEINRNVLVAKAATQFDATCGQKNQIIWQHKLVQNILAVDLIENGEYSTIVLYVSMSPTEWVQMRATYALHGHTVPDDFIMINSKQWNEFTLQYHIANPWSNVDICIRPILDCEEE